MVWATDIARTISCGVFLMTDFEGLNKDANDSVFRKEGAIMKERGFRIIVMILAAVIAATFAVNDAQAAIICDRTVTADLVVIDQPLMYNRLGAANINGMIFALRRDVIKSNTLLPLTAGGTATPGNVELRPDRRPRPLVLRVRQGDCLTVNLENLLTEAANPLQPVLNTAVTGIPFAVNLDDQPTDRVVGFHAAGMQLVNSIDDDGSMVGENPGAKGSL